MADLNYVSPLTSDLTDYYTKTEVDELQQGDENKYATQAQITAGDNEVKGWVASQGFLTQHQSLANYATKEYVNNAIEDIQIEGGVRISIVGSLPLEPEENVIYLTRKSEIDTDNVYNEWIWVPAIEDFELIGDTAAGVIPDLTEYATKTWVQLQGYLTSVSANGVAFNNQASGLDSTNVEDAIGEVNGRLQHFPMSSELASVAFSGDYDDLVNRPSIPSSTVAFSGDYADLLNKPVIPSLAGYATTNYVDTAVGAIVVPDVSGLASEQYVDDAVAAIDIPDVSGFVESSDLAAVATSGSYNDLTNKPTIPSTVGLATETYVNNAIAAIDIPDISGLASETYVDAEIANIDIPDVSDFITERQATSIAAGEAAGAVSNFENTLADVATSGDYNDLINKPTIPGAPTDATVGFTYQLSYGNIDSSTTTLQGALTQLDAAISNNTTAIDAIDIPDVSGFVESSDLATVATTGDYDDLINKPTIPVLPTLATVATSGSYNDLTNKPTIPEASQNYAPFITLQNSHNVFKAGIPEVSGKANVIKALKQGIYFKIGNSASTIEILVADNVFTDVVSHYRYNNTTKAYTKFTSNGLDVTKDYVYGQVAPNVIVSFAKTDLDNLFDFDNYDNTTSGLTATTVQAAIDELAVASGASAAEDIEYDNTNSGMQADTVQDAIDEVYALADGINVPGWELTETYNANAFELTLAVEIAQQ